MRLAAKTDHLFVHRPPFSYEYMPVQGHFRIHDADDNALCFCFSEGNAREVVELLNRASTF